MALRTWRVSQGIDQTQLADALGVRRQTVSLWELGRSSPYPLQAARLRELMGSHFPSLEVAPVPVHEVLDAAKAALDAWYADFRAKIIAAAVDAHALPRDELDATVALDNSDELEAEAVKRLMRAAETNEPADPAPPARKQKRR